MNTSRRHVRIEKQIAIFLLFLIVLALALLTTWWAPMVAAWVITGHLRPYPLIHALQVLAREITHTPHAEAYYPQIVRHAARSHHVWWVTIGVCVVTETIVLATLLRAADARASRATVDRRFYHLAGLSPRTFGRTHTIGKLLRGSRRADRTTIGRVKGRLLSTLANLHMLVIAPPQTGKSSSVIIPAILEHQGHVVSTTVKTDVRDETIGRRQQLGDVYQWDPFNPDPDQSDFYDPLQGCEDWGTALRVSKWLGEAVNIEGQGHQGYFDQEAESLLAPLVYAAALAEQGSITHVFDWLLKKNSTEPEYLIRQHQELGLVPWDDAESAILRLGAVFAYNDRQFDGVVGTARMFLKVYGHPQAKRTARKNHPRSITPEKLFAAGQANTLYIVADRDDQKQLTPLIVLLINQLVYYLDQQSNRGNKLEVSTLFAIDECANIAPLEELDRILSSCLPNSRFIIVFHDVSQMEERFGETKARDIRALCKIKIYLGSTTDQPTVNEINSLIGQGETDTVLNPEIISAQRMQQQRDEEGLLIHGFYPPTVYKQRRWFEDPHLRQLAVKPEPIDHTSEPAADTPPRELLPGDEADEQPHDIAEQHA